MKHTEVMFLKTLRGVMSISPMTPPNLLRRSSSSFSSFSDEDENSAVSSSQKMPLKDWFKSFIDHLGYKTYSAFNPPSIRSLGWAHEQYELNKKKFFENKPISYEEARKRVLSYTEDNRGTWGPDLEIKNVDRYADPEFRKIETKAYADRLFEGEWKTSEDKDKEWCVLRFCKEELHDLYKKEPKYLSRYFLNDLWMIKSHNKPILARHKKEWDQLSEKIFRSRKYEIAVGLSTVTAYFLLCHYVPPYQRLQITSTALCILKKHNK